MIIEVNHVNLNIETFGSKSDPCVLLIMGASASKTWWEEDFCKELASHHRFVIRYDQRDTGESTYYPPGQPGYGMDELAEDAIAILDYLGIEKAHLVGMSLGGKVSNIIALMHPERVSSIVFIASGAWDDKYYELPQPDARMIAYWSSTEKSRLDKRRCCTCTPDKGLGSYERFGKKIRLRRHQKDDINRQCPCAIPTKHV